MTIRRTKPFVKAYIKLPKKIRDKVDQQLRHLVKNHRHPGLKARKMSGGGGIWEARIDYHYRITFSLEKDRIIIRQVGTHQIYRNP